MRQLYSVTRVKNGQATVLGEALASPPCNIGPFSTPDYDTLAQQAVHVLPSGETVFAGQRAEGFYVDLGSVFDLLDLRPFQNLHVNPMPAAPGVDGTNRLNVHTIAIQLPKSMLTARWLQSHESKGPALGHRRLCFGQSAEGDNPWA